MTRKMGLTALILMIAFSIALAGCGGAKSDTSGTGASKGSESSSDKDAGKSGTDSSKDNGGETAGLALSGEVTVWTHPFVGDDAKEQMKTVWNDIIASFNSKYPNVKVNLEEIPWANRAQKQLTAITAGTGPDVFYTIPDQIAQFAAQNVLEPLDGYVKDNNMDDFNKSSLEAASYKGTLYALPMLQTSEGLFYNPDIVKAIGESVDNLPKTWDEFKAWGEKARAKGYYVRNFEGANTPNENFYPMIWQAGGDIMDADGNILVNKPEAVEAFKFLKEMYDKKWIPEDSVTAIDTHLPLFVNGKMLAVFGSGATLGELKAKNVNFVMGPTLQGKAKATYGTTGMWAVSKTSKNKEAAAAFAKHLTGVESMKKFDQLTQYIPPRKSASDIYANDKDQQQFIAWAEDAKPGVLHPVARSIIPKVQAEYQALLQGQKSPEQAADDLAKDIENEIKKQ